MRNHWPNQEQWEQGDCFNGAGAGGYFIGGRPPLIKSLQRGTIAITATSNTATITPVSTSNSRLRLCGYGISGASTNNKMAARGVLTNATTITVSVNTSTDITVTVSYEVTEYNVGVLKSVQRGTVAGNTTATITSVVTTKTEIDWLGSSGSDVNTNLTSIGRLSLTNATTVTGTSVGGANDTIGYQAAEVNA